MIFAEPFASSSVARLAAFDIAPPTAEIPRQRGEGHAQSLMYNHPCTIAHIQSPHLVILTFDTCFYLIRIVVGHTRMFHFVTILVPGCYIEH